MDGTRIHLIAPAGVCRPFMDALGVASGEGLTALIQEIVGSKYEVVAQPHLLDATEDERHGGRKDDSERAAEIAASLADDAVVAVLALRGGAWFTRLLPRIDFSVLDRRTRPVAVFGFSELTTLVNIVGAYAQGRGVYDMGPAFLTYGLKRFATLHAQSETLEEQRPADWVEQRLRPELDAYVHDVIAMIDGRGTSRQIAARLVRGDMPKMSRGSFTGGNLTVLSTMVGSPFETRVRPQGKWLILEDFNDKIERVDRFLAHLTLAGWWDGCVGLLLGDFHKGYEDLTPAVVELLDYHVPVHRQIPVLLTKDVGHVWPMSPLPLHTELTLEQISAREYTIHWPELLM